MCVCVFVIVYCVFMGDWRAEEAWDFLQLELQAALR